MKLLRDNITGEPLTFNHGAHWKIAGRHHDYSILVDAGTKLVTVADLKNQIGTTGIRSFLYCENCGAECSANAGDYFNLPKETVMVCCDEPMQLMTKREVFTLANH